ncbi:MAG: glycosyltransferase family 4 protein [Lachnospiraceae bacterium]|nr:glycosyltransferase family 4 protein [Lachnospiraceae bacterium]
MKILIVISELKYSGAAKIAAWLANSLAESDLDVTLLTFLGEKDSQIVNKNVKQVKIKIDDTSRWKRTLKAIRQIHKTIAKHKYNVLISFLPLEGFVSVLASVHTKTKVIVAERSDPYNEKSIPANIFRFFFRFADGAVFQSSGAMAYYPRKLKQNSRIIENPVLRSNVPMIPYEDRYDEIVSVSRMEIKQKRQDLLLKAFAIVAETKKTVKLKLIGDGPDMDDIKALSKELGIYEQVIFIGKSSDVLKEISHSKVFVFASDFEGMPNAILEALSMGVPVITTDYSPGGAIELVSAKERGFVVPRGNEKLLAEKMIYTLNHADRAAEMSANAVEIYTDNSETEILKRWMEYITHIAHCEMKRGAED